MIWLGRGIVGDDTDGHIDELARFVGPRTVVCAIERDPQDENYEPLADNFERLSAATDAQGRPLEVDADRSAPPAVSRRPAAAGQLHEFLHCQRRGAGAGVRRSGRPGGLRHAWPRCFPAGRFIRLRAVDLAWGLGAFHCITQQQPALPRRRAG